MATKSKINVTFSDNEVQFNTTNQERQTIDAYRPRVAENTVPFDKRLEDEEGKLLLAPTASSTPAEYRNNFGEEQDQDLDDREDADDPAQILGYLRVMADSMSGIRAMCLSQTETFELRLKQLADKFQKQLLDQQKKHDEETSQLREQISRLEHSTTTSRSGQGLGPRPQVDEEALHTHAQSPQVLESQHEELMAHFNQMESLAADTRKSREVSAQPRSEKPLRANNYDGTTSWEDYKAQFDLIAENNRWANVNKAIHLAASLKGNAQAILGDLDERSRRDYSSLVAALSCRFGAEHQTDLYRSQLKTLTRKKDQSLPELAQATQRLTRQAYPDASQTLREELARDNFIDALPDADVRWRIKQTRPPTLRAALTTAVEFEAFQLADRQRTRAARAVQPNKEEPSTSKTTPPAEDLDKKLGKMVEMLQSLVMATEKRSPKQVKSSVECWNCGKKGHVQRECRSRPKSATPPPTSRTNNGDRDQGNAERLSSEAGAQPK